MYEGFHQRTNDPVLQMFTRDLRYLAINILPKRSPRRAGAFCRAFTEKKSPQCRAYTWALQMEKSISPLFPGPEGAVVANDWCIITFTFACMTKVLLIYEIYDIFLGSPY